MNDIERKKVLVELLKIADDPAAALQQQRRHMWIMYGLAAILAIATFLSFKFSVLKPALYFVMAGGTGVFLGTGAVISRAVAQTPILSEVVNRQIIQRMLDDLSDV